MAHEIGDSAMLGSYTNNGNRIDFLRHIEGRGTYMGNSAVFDHIMETRTVESLRRRVMDVNFGTDKVNQWFTDGEREEMRWIRQAPKHILAAMVCEWES